MEAVHAQLIVNNINKIFKFNTAKVFFLNNGEWNSKGDNYSEVGPELSLALHNLSPSCKIKKIPNPSRAMFLLANGNVAVVVELGAKTRKDTLAEHLRRLDDAFNAATSSYHAHHDELTGVLNRHGLRHALQNLGCEFEAKAFAPADSNDEFSTNTDIVLFSFDIDHFKKVNDTFGHAAGDSVLKIFSTRLRDTATNLEATYSLKFILGRPGGEEFELIAIGTTSASEINEIGETLLQEIRHPLNSPLSGSNRSKEAADTTQGPQRLPQTISASIGVSLRVLQDAVYDIDVLYSELKTEADAALYRGKADGRNCIRVYDNIRRLHGRVAEHHEFSDLLQIDIGRKVGVQLGDIYVVHFPPYRGGENMLDRNSQTKIVAEYPQVASARIRVINVQPDASTAVILDRATPGSIPRDSLLRYEYVGSRFTSHNLRANHSSLTDNLSDLSDRIDEMQRAERLGALCSVARVLIKDDPRTPESRLDEFVLAVHLLFPSGSLIFHGSGGGTYILVPKFSSGTINDIKKCLEFAIAELERINVKALVGVCFPSTIPKYCATHPGALIFYANAARPWQSERKKMIHYFDHLTPKLTLVKWRRAGQIENALVDYQQFSKFGFSSSSLNNQIGLVILENEATELFPFVDLAFSQPSTSKIPRPKELANLGILRVRRSNYQSAFTIFTSIDRAILETNAFYMLGFAKSALELHRSNQGMDKVELTELMLSAVNIAAQIEFQPSFKRLLSEIKSAIKTGNFD